MTTLVAITGGIGSGKSTFSRVVRSKGFKLLDSDEFVADIYKNPTNKFLKYLKKINLDACITGKRIDKKKVAQTIFSDKQTKSKLETYIFKEVREDRKKFIKKHKKLKTKIVFFDIPLLFENNLSTSFDINISIISKKKERYKRLKRSRNMSKELFKKIVKSQTTDVERKKISHIIVTNNKSRDQYIKKINKVLERLV